MKNMREELDCLKQMVSKILALVSPLVRTQKDETIKAENSCMDLENT